MKFEIEVEPVDNKEIVVADEEELIDELLETTSKHIDNDTNIEIKKL